MSKPEMKGGIAAALQADAGKNGRDAENISHSSSLILKRDMPLVPAASIAGRALVTVIAIMTFLASLTAGGALLIADAAKGWQASVATEMTIQIKPAVGRDTEAEIKKAADITRATPGISEVRVFTKAESQRLLEPWLGTGLDLAELPVPRMMTFKVDAASPPDTKALRTALASKVPSASLDDHRVWSQRLVTMAQTIVLGAAFIFMLVLAAMAMAVAFATRGAMAGNQEIINVLHFVGAEDSFIASQFQRHFLLLGLKGGAVGSGFAIVFFALSGIASRWWTATPEGDQIEALFGTFSLGPAGFLVLGLIAFGVALMTGIMSRMIVQRHLNGLG